MQIETGRSAALVAKTSHTDMPDFCTSGTDSIAGDRKPGIGGWREISPPASHFFQYAHHILRQQQIDTGPGWGGGGAADPLKKVAGSDCVEAVHKHMTLHFAEVKGET